MTAKRPLPELRFLRECVALEEDTGALTWRQRPKRHFATEAIWATWNTRWAGKPAFASLCHNGYAQGSLDGKNYMAHRVVWKLIHGEEPGEIDHANGKRADNRPDNLRGVDRSANCKNSALRSDNTSGHVGVTWDRSRLKWKAEIQNGGRVRRLGRFSTLEDAIEARRAAQAGMGFSERHGRAG